MLFKLKRDSPLEKLMGVYTRRQGQPPGTFRFICHGSVCALDSTPEDVRSHPRPSPPPVAAH